MRVAALLYHDVVEGDDFDSSGLPGAGAAIYKLDRAAFERHLEGLAALATTPVRVTDPVPEVSGRPGWMLTFDDGGASAVTIGNLLARRGWCGHFFITGNRIGEPGFVSADAIRDLDAAGHVVGSHSWSHPPRISALDPERLVNEWRTSVEHLSGILQRPVDTASVPGGFYLPRVARAAEAAGIRWLFTSEPVLRHWSVGHCRVFGRLNVQRDTPASTAARLAAGEWAPRARQWVTWNLRKAAKRTVGPLYERGREAMMRRRYPASAGG